MDIAMPCKHTLNYRKSYFPKTQFSQESPQDGCRMWSTKSELLKINMIANVLLFAVEDLLVQCNVSPRK